MKIIAAIIITMACAACRPAPPEATENRQAPGTVAYLPDAAGSSVTRIDDAERGVTCYVSDGYKSGGISCIKN